MRRDFGGDFGDLGNLFGRECSLAGGPCAVTSYLTGFEFKSKVSLKQAWFLFMQTYQLINNGGLGAVAPNYHGNKQRVI